MKLWNYIIELLYPIPLVCLFFLCIPLPSFIRIRFRTFFLKVIDSFLFLRIPGAGQVTISFCATILSLALFLTTTLDTITALQIEIELRSKESATRALVESKRCSRWRAERNFWISLLSVFLWIALYRVRGLMHEVIDLESRIKDE